MLLELLTAKRLECVRCAARLWPGATGFHSRRLLWTRIEFKGAKNQASGSVKETVGKVTGDKATEAEGKAQKVGGKVQREAGKAKDAVRETLKK